MDLGIFNSQKDEGVMKMPIEVSNPIARKAYLLSQKGKNKQAIAVLREAIQKGNATVDVYGMLNVILSGVGQKQEALEVINKGLEVYPGDSGLLEVAHDHYVDTGDLEQAFSIVQKWFTIHSDPIAATYVLRECLVLGFKNEALEIIRRRVSASSVELSVTQKGWAWTIVDLIGEQIFEEDYYLAVMDVFEKQPDSRFWSPEISEWLIQEYERLPKYMSVTIQGAIACLKGLRYYLLGRYQKTEEIFQDFISSVDINDIPGEFPKRLYFSLLNFLNKNLYVGNNELASDQKFIETLQKMLNFGKSISAALPAVLPVHYDLMLALARERRWEEALSESEFVLRYEPDNPAALSVNVSSRVMGGIWDQKTFRRAQKWYRQEPHNHTAWSIRVQFLRKFEYFSQVVEEVDNYLDEFAAKLTQTERIVVLDALFLGCSETKRYDLLKLLLERCKEDVLELLISIHGAQDKEEALRLFNANLAALEGDFEKARNLASHTSNADVALARIEFVRKEWEEQQDIKTSIPEVVTGTELTGTKRNEVIADLVKDVLRENFGTVDSPKKNPSPLILDQLCRVLVTREPSLGRLSAPEKRQINQLARNWCQREQQKFHQQSEPKKSSSSIPTPQPKLFAMGNVHEQIVVLAYSIDWLARYRKYEKEQKKPLMLIPQFGDWPHLERELLIPDINYQNELIDAKLGRAEENIRDTIELYSILQWEALGYHRPITVVVSKWIQEIAKALKDDPGLRVPTAQGVEPAYQLRHWKTQVEGALAICQKTLEQFSRFSKEDRLLKDIERFLDTLGAFLWDSAVSIVQLQGLEVLVFHLWHEILEYNPFYMEAIQNTRSFVSKFPRLKNVTKPPSELKLVEKLHQQLQNLVVLRDDPQKLEAHSQYGRKIFSKYFGKVLIKGFHYTSDEEGRICYAPNPFSEEDYESPFRSPFLELFAKEEERKIMRKMVYKKGHPRAVDIYKGRVAKPKYIHEVVRAVMHLVERTGGDKQKQFSFPKVFQEFLASPLAQNILQNEYQGNQTVFAKNVRRSMYATPRLNVQLQNGVLHYSINPRYWEDQQRNQDKGGLEN